MGSESRVEGPAEYIRACGARTTPNYLRKCSLHHEIRHLLCAPQLLGYLRVSDCARQSGHGRVYPESLWIRFVHPLQWLWISWYALSSWVMKENLTIWRCVACGKSATGYTAAINQLAFGSAPGLGAGDACGRCFAVTANADPFSPAYTGPFTSIVVKVSWRARQSVGLTSETNGKDNRLQTSAQLQEIRYAPMHLLQSCSEGESDARMACQ